MDTKLLLLIGLGVAVLVGLLLVPAHPAESSRFVGTWEGTARGTFTLAIPSDAAVSGAQPGDWVTSTETAYDVTVAIRQGSEDSLSMDLMLREKTGTGAAPLGSWTLTPTIEGNALRASWKHAFSVDGTAPVAETTLTLDLVLRSNLLEGEGSLEKALLNSDGQRETVGAADGRTALSGETRTFQSIQLHKTP